MVVQVLSYNLLFAFVLPTTCSIPNSISFVECHQSSSLLLFPVKSNDSKVFPMASRKCSYTWNDSRHYVGTQNRRRKHPWGPFFRPSEMDFQISHAIAPIHHKSWVTVKPLVAHWYRWDSDNAWDRLRMGNASGVGLVEKVRLETVGSSVHQQSQYFPSSYYGCLRIQAIVLMLCISLQYHYCHMFLFPTVKCPPLQLHWHPRSTIINCTHILYTVTVLGY